MSSQPRRFVQVALFIFGLQVFALGFQRAADPLDEVSGLLLTDQYEEAQALLIGLPESAQGIALKGEIEFRKGNFEAARTQYRRSLELDPETSRAHYGLGKLAMAKMESKEAVRSVMKAVELDPEEAIYRLTAAAAWGIDRNLQEQTRQFEAYVALEPSYDPDRVAEVQAALDVIQNFGSEKMSTYEIPDDQEPIPILKAINLIFADFMVGEKGPFEFIVDTGASQTVFTEKLVNELGLEPIASTLIHGIGGDGKVDTNIYRIDELKFGDIEIRNLPIGSIDEPMISELAAGIFSTATFSDQVVSIDYRRDRIEFNAPEVSDNVEHIPSWFFNNLVLIPLTINGETPGEFPGRHGSGHDGPLAQHGRYARRHRGHTGSQDRSRPCRYRRIRGSRPAGPGSRIHDREESRRFFAGCVDRHAGNIEDARHRSGRRRGVRLSEGLPGQHRLPERRSPAVEVATSGAPANSPPTDRFFSTRRHEVNEAVFFASSAEFVGSPKACAHISN